jgi:hypothetical protein
MILADVLKILFLVVGTLMTIVSYWLLFEALIPQRLDRLRGVYEARPWRALFMGLLISVPLIIVGLALLNAPAGGAKLAGFVLLFLLTLAGLAGSTGLVRLIGLRLPSAHDTTAPWRRVLRGGIVLSLTFLLPGVGWFVVLPATLISGVGAILLSRERRMKPVPGHTPQEA